MEELKISLEQSWAKKLTIHFLNAAESDSFLADETVLQLNQVHGDRVVSWSEALAHKKQFLEADAFVATGDAFKKSRKKLMIKTADCVPLIYVDRESKSVAAVHAGWKGLQKKIHLKIFKEFSFRPQTTWVWCGPSLNGDSFEVREDMREKFSTKKQKNSQIFKEKSPGLYSFSPWSLISQDFEDMGVELFYNFEINTLKNEEFYSYRRDPQNAGRNYSLVYFKA